MTDGNSQLREELLRMKVEHEQIRGELARLGEPPDHEVLDRYEDVSRRHIDRLAEILRATGWPGERLVGPDGAHAAWLIAQHADMDPSFQTECLQRMEEALARGEVSPLHVAYLTDRVRVRANQPQVYGTQTRFVEERLEPYPIEDEVRADELRRAVGLPPLKDYLPKLKDS